MPLWISTHDYRLITVPVLPAIPSAAFSNRVIRDLRPGMDVANESAASTLGSMDPLANCPWAIKLLASPTLSSIEPLHIGFAEVDGDLLYRGEDDQHVGIDKLRQLGTGPIFVDHRAGTAQVIAFAQHRNAAATDGDHHLTGCQHRRDGLLLDDIDGFGRGHYPAIAATGVLFEPLALGHQCFGLLLAEETADGLARVKEGGIVFIHLNLGHQSSNRLVDAAFQQGFAQSILQVITDVALTQGHADRHRQMGGFLARSGPPLRTPAGSSPPAARCRG